MKFTNEVTIHKSREEVWEIFDNPENLKEWQPTLQHYEPERGRVGQEGSVMRLTYVEDGEETVLVETVAHRKEPEELSSTFESDTVRNEMNNRFVEEAADRTLWILDSEFVFEEPLPEDSVPFVREAIESRIREDMQRFKAVVESQEADGSGRPPL
ncbi:MAG: SRPBCC family protein [Rubrobacteraceae bacterium]